MTDVTTHQQLTPAEVIADGIITAKIRSALLADPLTGGYSIHIASVRARIRLDGFVEFAAVRQRALQIAAQVEGVVLVEDLLEIRRRQ